jgi:HEAT repeat protein
MTLALCLLLAACEGTPKDPAGWARAATRRNGAQEKIDAIQQARTVPGDKKAAVPDLIALLKDAPKVRAEAAQALGEAGDPSAVQPLADALDLGDSGGRASDTREANREIAKALGVLHSRAAVPTLLKLTRSGDDFTQVAAIDALGDLGDAQAVKPLMELAESDSVEPFKAKKALLALGKLGAADAAPTIMKMLFRERSGVSFFPEAAFATSQIGRPMSAPLLAVLKGQNPELRTWAREQKVLEGALYAKAAQLLGDVGDAAAIPALVEKLAYKDEDVRVQYLVRLCAAESLGRLRAKEAVKPLTELIVKEQEPNVRDTFCTAVARIGDPGAIPLLVKAVAAPTWDLREGPLTAISRLGGAGERGVVTGAQAKECQGNEPCDEDTAAKRKAAFGRMLARLQAAETCKKDVACWTGKLGDKDAAVRDRAALELGTVGGPAQAEALAGAVVAMVDTDEEIAARYQALLALDWITARGQVPGAAGVADKLEAMVAQEKNRNLTAGVNEDVKRLAGRLRRSAAK